MNKEARIRIVLLSLTGIFGMLAVAFALDLWGRPEPLRKIPLVDPSVLETQPWRRSYADLVAAEEDVSYFDCYLCHEENKKLDLTIDTHGVVVLPEEHEDLVMGHGNARTNHCFNCHNEKKLTLLQTLDGRELAMQDSTMLCGSCHSPILSDWKDGSHGRTSGNWNHASGPFQKLDCVNCHDPHAPRFPAREPAPGPNYLRAPGGGSHQAKEQDPDPTGEMDPSGDPIPTDEPAETGEPAGTGGLDETPPPKPTPDPSN